MTDSRTTEAGPARTDVSAARTALRDRVAEHARRWALAFPIPANFIAEGDRAERLAVIWGEQIARALLPVVEAWAAEQMSRTDADLAETKKHPAAARAMAKTARRYERERDAERQRAEQAEAAVQRVREALEVERAGALEAEAMDGPRPIHDARLNTCAHIEDALRAPTALAVPEPALDQSKETS